LGDFLYALVERVENLKWLVFVEEVIPNGPSFRRAQGDSEVMA